jgi:hypothetical protein
MSNQDVAETFEIVWHGASVGADGEKGQLLPGYAMRTSGDVRARRIVRPQEGPIQGWERPAPKRLLKDEAEICRQRAEGVALKVLAAQYGVSMATICQLTKWRFACRD